MPLYEYECQADGSRFEVIQKFSDPPVTICPNCGGAVRKLVSSPAIQFKGTGWYITDYARKGKDGGSHDSKDGGKGNKEASREAGRDANASREANKEAKDSGSDQSSSTTTASSPTSDTKTSSPQSTSAPSAGSSPSGSTGSST